MRFIVDYVIWGWPLIISLLLVSLYFGFRTRFVQVRLFKHMPKLLFIKNEDRNQISSFQSAMLILASHIGVGNIIGVSLAIMYGGPGSVFWMWVAAVMCSVLAFVENTLGQLYKEEVHGQYKGGPAYYILHGLKSPLFANVVAFVLFLSIGLLMPTIQASTIIIAVNSTFYIPKTIIALSLCGLIGYIIFGNSKKIIQFAEVCVPFMAVGYLLVTFIIVFFHFDQIGKVLFMIFESAFNQESYYGGMMGAAVSLGFRRGIFSNEAGVGSTPNISASANVSHPVIQGLVSSFCVFIDTIVVCTASAIMILVSGSYNIVFKGKNLFVGLAGKDYTQFVEESINTIFTGWGPFFIAIALFFFAFTSLFGAFFNAQSNLMFIFKKSKYFKRYNTVYKFLFLFMLYLSAVFNNELAWLIADLGNGLIAWINLIVIVLLSSKVVEALRDYELKYKQNKKLIYSNEDLDCWKKR
jgi:alanine or glycine:cation symporter, AGCS family